MGSNDQGLQTPQMNDGLTPGTSCRIYLRTDPPNHDRATYLNGDPQAPYCISGLTYYSLVVQRVKIEGFLQPVMIYAHKSSHTDYSEDKETANSL